jgi:hypothetical protein
MVPTPTFTFRAKIWYWRGPAPYHFVTMSAKHSRDIKAISDLVTYGWGMIPVEARVGETTWTTSLFEKDGRYIVPIRDSVRKSESLAEGDAVALQLTIAPRQKPRRTSE